MDVGAIIIVCGVITAFALGLFYMWYLIGGR